MISDREPVEVTPQLVKYEQPTDKPVPKIMAVGQSGAVVAGIVALLALFGVIIPDDISSQAEAALKALFVILPFMQAIIQFLAGYFKRDEKPLEVVKAIHEEAESVGT